MNDFWAYYSLCGFAYAIIAEYNYRISDQFDTEEAWSTGYLFGMLMEGVYNSVFWPKLIVDGMIEAYFSAFNEDDDL